MTLLGVITNLPLERWKSIAYFRTVLAGIEAEAEVQGLDLQFCLEDELHDMPDVAGWIGISNDDRTIERLEQFGKPGMLINRIWQSRTLGYVSVDEADTIRVAVRHLRTLGHRRIGYLGHAWGDMMLVNRERMERLREIARQPDMEIDEPLIIRVHSPMAAVVRAALNIPDPVTALICFSDVEAIRLLNALHKSSVAVPEQFSVLGVNDLPEAVQATPPLTTVRLPLTEQGRAAVQGVIALLNGARPVRTVSHPELILRGTTGPARNGAKA